MNRPGNSLRRIAARAVSVATMSRVVDPVIADWQAEHAEAVGQGAAWKSRWVWYSGYVVLLKTLVVYGCWQAAAMGRDWSVEDRSMLGRMVATFACVTFVLMTLTTLPVVAISVVSDHQVSAAMVALLLPHAISIAAPIGLLLGILYTSRRLPLSRRVTRAGFAVALVVSLGSYALLSEMVPATNQAFRVEQGRLWPAGDVLSPQRGRAELTLAELGQRVVVARDRGFPEHVVKSLSLDYHQRRALAFAALPLAMFALMFGNQRRRYGFGIPGVAALGVTAFYYMLMMTGRGLVTAGAMPALVVWLPHVAVLVISAVVAFRSRRKLAPSSNQSIQSQTGR